MYNFIEQILNPDCGFVMDRDDEEDHPFTSITLTWEADSGGGVNLQFLYPSLNLHIAEIHNIVLVRTIFQMILGDKEKKNSRI